MGTIHAGFVRLIIHNKNACSMVSHLFHIVHFSLCYLANADIN